MCTYNQSLRIPKTKTNIMKGRIYHSSVMAGDFDTTLSIMVKTIAKNNEDIEDFKSTRK